MKDRIIKAIKKLFNPGSRKRLYENIAIIGILGIVLLVAGNTLFTGITNEKPILEQTKPVLTEEATIKNDELTQLEKDLQAILVKIKGVGKVSVMLTAYGQNEIAIATDKKNSVDRQKEYENSSVAKEVEKVESEENVTYKEDNGQKEPIVLKEISPQIKGVLVVCTGAGSPIVKENITKAVVALFDIPIFKINVVEGG